MARTIKMVYCILIHSQKYHFKSMKLASFVYTWRSCNITLYFLTVILNLDFPNQYLLRIYVHFLEICFASTIFNLVHYILPGFSSFFYFSRVYLKLKLVKPFIENNFIQIFIYIIKYVKHHNSKVLKWSLLSFSQMSI